MNAFTDAAKAVDENVPVNRLVQKFLTGQNAKSAGNLQSLDGSLYSNTTVVARRCKDGSVLLSNANLPNVELNDALVGSLFANNVPFRRLNDFGTLLSATKRVEDLRAGRYDDFKAIAKLFDFTVTDSDIEAIEKSKEFTKRVNEFFTKIENEELDRIRTAAEKERLERVRREAITWDNGDGLITNSQVSGAGGNGQRLRLSKDKKYVECSKGHTYGVKGAEKIWNSCSSRWHGSTSMYRSSSLYIGNRYVNIYKDRVEIGCQTIYKTECERFADVMGWPRKEKKVKK